VYEKFVPLAGTACFSTDLTRSLPKSFMILMSGPFVSDAMCSCP